MVRGLEHLHDEEKLWDLGKLGYLLRCTEGEQETVVIKTGEIPYMEKGKIQDADNSTETGCSGTCSMEAFQTHLGKTLITLPGIWC